MTPGDDHLDSFIRWYRATGKAPGTVYGRTRYLKRLACDMDPLTATPDDLLMWLASHEWAPETRKSARQSLGVFFDWAQRHDLRADNPMDEIAPPHLPPPCPHPVPDSVLAKARLAATPDERLMLDLGALAGLRAAEIAGLPTDALEDDYLRITGKGSRVRVVPIPDELAARIRSRPDGWVFPGRFPGEHISIDYVVKHLSALLGPRFTAHSLRHRFASKVYDQTGDLLALQSLLGHSSPVTTRRYVAVPMHRLRAASLAAAS